MKGCRLYFHLPSAILHLTFLFTSVFTYSQSDVIKYAREIIDTLCSPSMHGRGYVNKGDSIAADYIKKEFEKFGVKQFGKEFEQRFSFPVNTITEVWPNIFYLNDRKLISGKDFIVTPSSYNDPGEGGPLYEVKWLDSSILYNPKKFLKFVKDGLRWKY